MEFSRPQVNISSSCLLGDVSPTSVAKPVPAPSALQTPHTPLFPLGTGFQCPVRLPPLLHWELLEGAEAFTHLSFQLPV